MKMGKKVGGGGVWGGVFLVCGWFLGGGGGGLVGLVGVCVGGGGWVGGGGCGLGWGGGESTRGAPGHLYRGR